MAVALVVPLVAALVLALVAAAPGRELKYASSARLPPGGGLA